MFYSLRVYFWNWAAITFLKICKRFDIYVDVKGAFLEGIGERYDGNTVIDVAKYYMEKGIITFDDYCDIIRECKNKTGVI